MKSRLTIFVVSLALVGAALAAPITITPPCGPITGYTDSLGSSVFRGIPYGEAPIGSLRFQPPVPKKDWSSAISAVRDGKACMQQCELPPHTCPEEGMSEDCLFLNVFAPNRTTSKVPVMVYFHGGNYKQGLAGGPLYNGTYLVASSQVVIVVANYRLGALGYVAYPDAGLNGNYGLLDQQAALQWVQRNIASFGGDPNRVTVFGQSAGAGSIATHLISPLFKGLFHGAILQSNPFTIPFRDSQSMPKIAAALLKNAGCAAGDVNCLKALPAEQIIEAQVKTEVDLDAVGDSLLHAFLPWTPVVEGQIVPKQPLVAFEAGETHDVPVMMGTVLDESVPFIYGAFGKPLDSFSYSIFASLIFGGDRGKRVLDRYPVHNTSDAREDLVTVGNEFIFHCSNRDAARSLSSRRSTYLYLFDHLMSFSKEGWGPDFPECYNRVCHAEEIAFVWASASWLFNYTAEEKAFARELGKYFTNFAYTGNPSTRPSFEEMKNIPVYSDETVSSSSITPSSTSSSPASLDAEDALEGIAASVGLASNRRITGRGCGRRVTRTSRRDVTVREWPAWTPQKKELMYLSIKKGINPVGNYLDDQCNFWDSIKYFI